MKYVRNFEDLKKFTFEFFDSFLPENLSEQMANNFLLNLSNQNLEDDVAKRLEQKDVEIEPISSYGEVILQLNGYKDILKKYVELLLKAKKYEHLCEFLNRIFLQQIGDVKYRSSKKQYSIKERYFDRFIEIVMFCEINKDLYLPFFVKIFNSDSSSIMFEYKEPLKEYLDVHFKNGQDDEFISSLLNNDNKSGISEYATTSTLKTLNTLIDGFVAGEINNTSLIRQALTNHLQEGFNILENLLTSEDEEVQYKACQLLLLIKFDKRVKDRAKYLYENTNNSKIKYLLERECGFTSLEGFKSKEEFLDYVEKDVTQIQERLYGARLKRYYYKYNLDNTGLNGKILTFVMETFKDKYANVNLHFYKDYFKYVDGAILQNLSWVVYEVAIYREKLLSSKWALRLIATFGSSELILSMCNLLDAWYNNTKTYSYAKYFLELLSEIGREELIELCKVILNNEELTNKQKKFLEDKIKCLSVTTKQSLEEVKDKLSNELEFNSSGERMFQLQNRTIMAKIERDCTIKLYNPKTNKPARIKDDVVYNGVNLKTYLKTLEKEVKKNKKRLLSAFLEFRNYTTQTFQTCIVENSLLNYLSQFVVWGRYKKDKLAEVCMLSNNNLVHVVGNMITKDDEVNYTIAPLQSIDCVPFLEKLKEKIDFTLFNQFDFPIYDVNNFALNSTTVDCFNGVFCTAKLFITRLEKLKYRINDLDKKYEYSTLVKENANLNLLTVVEFEKVRLGQENNSTTISRVKFYNLNKLAKSGKNYLLSQHEPIAIGDLEPHVFSNELAQIYLACKN